MKLKGTCAEQAQLEKDQELLRRLEEHRDSAPQTSWKYLLCETKIQEVLSRKGLHN